jgi:hypothetical protein
MKISRLLAIPATSAQLAFLKPRHAWLTDQFMVPLGR